MESNLFHKVYPHSVTASRLMGIVALDLVVPGSTHRNSKTVVFIKDNLLKLININLISCESISLRYSKQANYLLWTSFIIKI
jgi:hypothetical protein